MNRHLNIYKTYTKEDRETGQLEDDLTRALAIALQENDVFAHQFLKYILNQKSNTYEMLFDDFSREKEIEIDIQKPVESIEGFDHLFAVRISGSAMKDNFFEQTHNKEYNPITDMFIRINNIAIIFEVKPGNQNSTAQLYNQALNTIKNNDDFELKDSVTPVDFNWPLIMEMALRVSNFQKAILKPSRILNDFISYIKIHNYNWLPQLPLSSLSFSTSLNSIGKRFRDVLESSDFQSIDNRLGFNYNFYWAQELLISFNEKNEEVVFAVYPGNTRAQGWHIFNQTGEPKFKNDVDFNGKKVQVHKMYHIKFSAFSSYFTGLWFYEHNLKEALYTRENFIKYSGRKKRDKHWSAIEKLFDASFKNDFDWREKCEWDNKVAGSNRTQFDLSFGYKISINIPYKDLQQIDHDKNNLEPLASFINQVKDTFTKIRN